MKSLGDQPVKVLVELGQALAQAIIPELGSPAAPTLEHDSSTNNLIRRHRKMKGAA